jgi:exonuclease III
MMNTSQLNINNLKNTQPPNTINNIDISSDTLQSPLNQNITFDPEPSAILRIATQNIQGLNTSQAKQISTIQLIKALNLDIVGLTETKLNPVIHHKTLKLESKHYFVYTHNHKDHYTGSGVALIMKKSIKKYIHQIKSIDGRIIYADLYLPQNYIIRIIVAYIPHYSSQTYTREEHTKYRQNLSDIVAEAYKMKYQTILLGDLNTNAKEYYEHKTNCSNVPNKLKILHHILSKFHLQDPPILLDKPDTIVNTFIDRRQSPLTTVS